MSLLNVERVYFEIDALNYSRGEEIYQKYMKSGSKMIRVDSHWKPEVFMNDPELVKRWNHVKSTYLVLGVKSAIASRPNCRSTDFIAPSTSNGCAMACAYCLPAGTMIETPEGSKLIEQIQDGDIVLAYDSLLGQLVEARVLGVASRQIDEVIEFEVDGVVLQASPEHPIMTRRGWVEAQHLNEDDEVLCDKKSLDKYRFMSQYHTMEIEKQ